MLIKRVQDILDATFVDIQRPRLVLGLSGGPDSICLLDILSRLRFDLVIAHLDHQIRASSGEESKFVSEIAGRYGLPVIVGKINILKMASERKAGIEETARDFRYQFLFQIAKQESAQAVLTAHQADDQVETILMNFIRGSGLKGITGMQVQSYMVYSDSIPILRPLLTTWREEILDYCRSQELGYTFDDSNLDTNYLRNEIRLKLIPELKKYNPKIKEAVLRLGENLTVDQKFFNRFTDQQMAAIQKKETSDSVVFTLAPFHDFDESVQRMIIKKMLEKKFLGLIDIEKRVIETSIQFFRGEFQTLSLTLGDQISLIRNKHLGIMTSNPRGISQQLWPNVEGSIRTEWKDQTIKLSDRWYLRIQKIENPIKNGNAFPGLSPFTACMDGDDLAPPINVRAWLYGDRFSPLGMGGKSVKLSDFWINHKVPGIARDSWPLVFCGEELIWIPGYQLSEKVRVTKHTEKVFQFDVRQN